MISVIIPAHNESSVIRRCLTAITAGAAPGDLEVIVVCNGCKDDTARQARAVGPLVKVIETPTASKANALNLGDEAATAFPRFYVDADVLVTFEALRQTAAYLQTSGALAAAPRIQFDTAECPATVRAFYSVWQKLPYCAQGTIGAGLYAVTEQGRSRFDRFPGLTADDTFVRLHFRPDERVVAPGCSFTVFPPRTIGGIIDIKTRSHFGTRQLRQMRPDLWKNESVDHGTALLSLLRDPKLLPGIAIYIYVRLVARWRARWKEAFGDPRRWERDETSRQVAQQSV